MKKFRELKLYIITMLLLLPCKINAYASGLENTELYKGTKALITNITTVLVGIVGIITIAFVVKDGIGWFTVDDQEKPRQKHKVFVDIAVGICIATAVGVISVIFNFYGVNVNS